MGSKIISQLSEFYKNSRPIIIVLLFAALIVFINSYPNVPSIAENTVDYRQQVKNKNELNTSTSGDLPFKPPASPSLPNTITPIISPEEVEEIAHPEPEPKPQEPLPGNESTGDIPITEPTEKDPSLGIKLLTGLINVAPLILIAAMGGFGIYLLFKYKKHFTIRSMFSSAIAIVAICALIFFGLISVNFIEFLYDISVNFNLTLVILIPIAAIAGIWISYNIISKRTTTFKRNMGLAFSGALMGAFLAAFLPFWIVFILLIAIALFDIYSVKYGPIKKILDLEEQNSKKRQGKKVEKLVVYRTLNSDSNMITRSNPTTKTPNVQSNFQSLETQNIDSVNNEKTIRTMTNSNSPSTIPKSSGNPIEPTNQPINQPTNQTTIQPTNQPADNKLAPGKTAKMTEDDEFDLILMYDNPDWSLGLGDFVIYSMFTSAVLTYFLLYLPYYIFYSPTIGLILPWLIFIICTFGLLLGFFLTLRLLQKRDYLPGLPITIGCGFLVFVICIIVLQVVNYILFNEFVIII
ncbi:hypothetical protein [[Eubacterium] cellulosolvens]